MGAIQRIDSSHSIWLFDSERMRFRRLPKGADPSSPSLEADWQPYFALDLDEVTGSFSVALNEDRTRLLRSWREAAPPPNFHDTTELNTAELRLDPAAE
ncbi:MAG: hypothetical protein JOZ99_06885 [Actinobacteria bacterium]|nr:hypothetical protein [Actinomycetota bacterium]